MCSTEIQSEWRIKSYTVRVVIHITLYMMHMHTIKHIYIFHHKITASSVLCSDLLHFDSKCSLFIRTVNRVYFDRSTPSPLFTLTEFGPIWAVYFVYLFICLLFIRGRGQLHQFPTEVGCEKYFSCQHFDSRLFPTPMHWVG